MLVSDKAETIDRFDIVYSGRGMPFRVVYHHQKAGNAKKWRDDVPLIVTYFHPVES